MVMTDPIADFLTRIRNANMVYMDKVEIPASKTKKGLAEILKEEGFAQPKAVKDATMSYQHDSDKMELFVEEFLEQEKDAECRTSAESLPHGDRPSSGGKNGAATASPFPAE